MGSINDINTWLGFGAGFVVFSFFEFGFGVLFLINKFLNRKYPVDKKDENEE
ncbi:MAG: hypothetical protein K2H01_05730 [Ruminococcus sp.]|nr:hypothetical protein [Ruminococcus sp.]